MSKFSDKIKAKQRREISSYTPEYKQAIWTLLIGCGGAGRNQNDDDWKNSYWSSYGTKVEIWSYYGGHFNVDPKLTEGILEGIREHSVDWEKCSDPATRVNSEFNGTFTDTQLYHEGLYGKLVLGNGESYWWAARSDEEVDSHDWDKIYGGSGQFANIQGLLNLELTLEEALEELEERLKGTYFEYTCKIPYLGQ